MVFLNGSVQVNRVVSGLGHGLDEAATRAAQHIKFKPAKRDSQPVDFRLACGLNSVGILKGREGMHENCNNNPRPDPQRAGAIAAEAAPGQITAMNHGRCGRPRHHE
jgi:hypothetical protein